MAKRKIRRKAAARRSTKKTLFGLNVPKFRFFGLIAVLLLGVLFINRRDLPHSVLGASVRPLYSKSVINWASISGATSYNVYYKLKTDTTYMHSLINLPTTYTMYTISYLKRGGVYQYTVAAVDASGAEFGWTAVKTMVLSPM